MKLALDKFSDNPIIDEILDCMDNTRVISSIRASRPMWRKPFIEIEYITGTPDHRHFMKDSFNRYWADAEVVLETLTNIQLMSEFDSGAVNNKEAMVETILSTRNACIRECEPMYEAQLYQVFVDQFGSNYKNLPTETLSKIETAKKAL